MALMMTLIVTRDYNMRTHNTVAVPAVQMIRMFMRLILINSRFWKMMFCCLANLIKENIICPADHKVFQNDLDQFIVLKNIEMTEGGRNHPASSALKLDKIYMASKFGPIPSFYKIN